MGVLITISTPVCTRTYMICSGNGIMVGHTTDLLTISTLFLILQLSVSASGRVAICSMLIYIYPKDIFVLILFIVAACRYSLYSKSTYHTPFVNQWGKKSIYIAYEKKSRSSKNISKHCIISELSGKFGKMRIIVRLLELSISAIW